MTHWLYQSRQLKEDGHAKAARKDAHDGVVIIIVGAAVAPHLLHIPQYLCCVIVCRWCFGEPALDGAQIHWLRNDIMIVIKTQGLCIHLKAAVFRVLC